MSDDNWNSSPHAPISLLPNFPSSLVSSPSDDDSVRIVFPFSR